MIRAYCSTALHLVRHPIWSQKWSGQYLWPDVSCIYSLIINFCTRMSRPKMQLPKGSLCQTRGRALEWHARLQTEISFLLHNPSPSLKNSSLKNEDPETWNVPIFLFQETETIDVLFRKRASTLLMKSHVLCRTISDKNCYPVI